jgi:hypothetical protein
MKIKNLYLVNILKTIICYIYPTELKPNEQLLIEAQCAIPDAEKALHPAFTKLAHSGRKQML